MTKLLLLLGGGGHCHACIDVIEAEALYRIAGIVQPASDGKDAVLGYPVLGSDEDLARLIEEIPAAVITVGQIKSPDIRIRLFNTLKSLGAQLPAVQSPFAYCSKHATVGEGTIVMHGALLNANACIGENCIINSQALIEHDAIVGDHCHISTGARLNGGVRIGSGTFVGSGAILREGINVGERAIIGAGQIILRDVPAGAVVRAKR